MQVGIVLVPCNLLAAGGTTNKEMEFILNKSKNKEMNFIYSLT